MMGSKKCGRFACAGFSTADQILAAENNRNSPVVGSVLVRYIRETRSSALVRAQVPVEKNS